MGTNYRGNPDNQGLIKWRDIKFWLILMIIGTGPCPPTTATSLEVGQLL